MPRTAGDQSITKTASRRRRPRRSEPRASARADAPSIQTEPNNTVERTGGTASTRPQTAKRGSDGHRQPATSRETGTGGRAAGGTQGDDQPSADSSWADTLESHRRRQDTVAAILDATFGKWAKTNPELWERRAYLLLVGLVYERLATDDALSTDELIKLAKALAENRRVEARTGKDRIEGDTSEPDEPADSNGQLPPRLAEAVRQVYGANLHNTESDVHAD